MARRTAIRAVVLSLGFLITTSCGDDPVHVSCGYTETDRNLQQDKRSYFRISREPQRVEQLGPISAFNLEFGDWREVCARTEACEVAIDGGWDIEMRRRYPSTSDSNLQYEETLTIEQGDLSGRGQWGDDYTSARTMSGSCYEVAPIQVTARR